MRANKSVFVRLNKSVPVRFLRERGERSSGRDSSSDGREKERRREKGRNFCIAYSTVEKRDYDLQFCNAFPAALYLLIMVPEQSLFLSVMTSFLVR